MAQCHLTDEVKLVRVKNAVAAGTSNQQSSTVDMTGYEAVRFIAAFGSLTAGQVTALKIQHSSDDSSYADVTGSQTANMADGDSNRMLVTDLIRPTKRYVQATVIRGTQNAVIDGVFAELYKARSIPVTQDTSVSASIKVSN